MVLTFGLLVVCMGLMPTHVYGDGDCDGNIKKPACCCVGWPLYRCDSDIWPTVNIYGAVIYGHGYKHNAKIMETHVEEFKDYTKQEEQRKRVKEKTGSIQTTLTAFPKSGDSYRPGEPRYNLILRETALLIAETTAPFSYVEQKRFRKYSKTLDPRCPNIGRKRLMTEMNGVWSDIRAKMQSELDGAGLIALSTDIWTKKGMTESFLGLNAHYVDAATRETRSCTLACRSFPSPHTAEKVYVLVKEILDEWKISPDRIIAILTDNGSNMVCAFKNFISAKLTIRDEEEFPSEETDEMYMLSTSDPLLDDAAVDNDSQQFLDFEDNEDRLYTDYNRHPCFIHTLQLVVRIFEKAVEVKPLMKKVRFLVSAFNKSANATTALIRTGKRKLICDVSTRWNSTLLMVRRLLELKDCVRKVIVDANLKVSDLSPLEWKILEGVDLLLGKFDTITDKMSSEKSATIHMILPYVKEINYHLENQSALDVYLDLNSYGAELVFAEVVAKMKEQMAARFAYVVDAADSKYKAIYLAANFLHVWFKDYLTVQEIKAARDELTRLFLVRQKACPNTAEESLAVTTSAETEISSAPLKKTKICELSYLTGITPRCAPNVAESLSGTALLSKELDTYCSVSASSDINHEYDPRMYWMQNGALFPLLSLLALDILAIGSSTADVERLFSAAGHTSSGRRNRVSGSRLEMQVFVKKNMRYIESLSDE
ncbi:uncharacterized protein LOC129602241 [Paramacrobiotus metropolitanus]|uniref:uncharacterized protein LOC129602241 n=1 Tax=Paramacrobiotus metropolitanus TaxID=2943436 RepID=UPI0024465CAD|nr:uncharacterized protein LOC129602241 [Paramacrobiotus metropolitanus]